MRLLYHLGIILYRWGIGLASVFSPKARLWISGRWAWEDRLRDGVSDGKDWIWFHCASLGEFEQGRPLIEALKAQNPERKILLSFFSPSGYELRKGYAYVDHVCYLPLDTLANAHAFLDIVNPRLIFFVKYDLWLNFIREIGRREIPLVLVSALVRKESRFLTSLLQSEYRVAFRSFSWIFTQDEGSATLLEKFSGNLRISVAGDTRFDRVAALPETFQPVPGIEEFIGGRRCIVVGSSWPPDEDILLPVIAELRQDGLCWIIAPHEIHASSIDHQVRSQPTHMVKYSDLEQRDPNADVLWIDNVGMLSRLYHYATIAYIGGGFGTGIHNAQEAAVYGNPVIIGPNYQKFQEAVDMVHAGGAISVSDAHTLKASILHWLDNAELLAETRRGNAAYILSKTGATQAILTKLHFLHYLDEQIQN